MVTQTTNVSSVDKSESSRIVTQICISTNAALPHRVYFSLRKLKVVPFRAGANPYQNNVRKIRPRLHWLNPSNDRLAQMRNTENIRKRDIIVHRICNSDYLLPVDL